MKTTIKMTKGESLFDERNSEPEICIQGTRSKTYLWIGNGTNPGGCFAILSGPKTLEKLAMTILRELGHEVSLK